MNTKTSVKNYLVVILPPVLVVLIIFFLIMPKVRENREAENSNKTQVSNFEECVAKGNPVMESYPRQCRHNDVLYIEEIEDKNNSSMNEAEALSLAQQSTECLEVGDLAESATYNPNSKTWWIDIVRSAEAKKDGCSPACVVFEETGLTEVNWRCTGLVLPDEDEEELSAFFKEKYPKYADTLMVKVNKKTGDYASGGITFVSGEAGGMFLAMRDGGEWKIVFEGNGAVDCEQMRNKYNFPDEILVPNFCD